MRARSPIGVGALPDIRPRLSRRPREGSSAAGEIATWRGGLRRGRSPLLTPAGLRVTHPQAARHHRELAGEMLLPLQSCCAYPIC